MTKSRRAALLIGVSTYRNMPPLRQPVADAQAMKQVLALNGNFECNILEDPDFAAMRSAIVEHFSTLKPPDTGLLFFSGHGMKHSGELYLCPTDMEPARPRNRGLAGEEIRQCIRDPEGARCHIIILDCCYAGAITKSDPGAGQDNEPLRREVFDPGSGSGVVFFNAAGPRSEVPAQSKGLEATANSPYTALLLQGLNGAAGGDNPYVTPVALDGFLKRAARESGLGLKPSYSSNNVVDDDEIRLTLNPMPGWGRVPDYVREALETSNASARIGAYFSLSVFAGNAREPALADVARRMLETRLEPEVLRDGRVSEAIRSMLRGLEAAAAQRALQQRLVHAESDRTALQAERNRVIEQLKDASENTNGLKAERDQLIEQLKKANETASGLKAERDQFIEQLKTANETAIELKAERNQLIEQLEEASEKTNGLKAERDQLIEQLKKANETASGLKAERDQLVEQLKEASENANGLKTERDQLIEQLKKANETESGLKAERDQLVEQLKEARENTNGLKAERDQLIEQLKKANETASGLKAERDQLIEQLERMTRGRGPVQRGGWRRKPTLLFTAAVGALVVGVLYEGYRITQRFKQPIIPAETSMAAPVTALRDRDQALKDRDDALRQRDDAEAARYVALQDRDLALKDRDKAIRDLQAFHQRPAESALFDPNSESNPTNVTPSGRPWNEEDICKGYLSGNAKDWWNNWQLEMKDGTYHVWVFSKPDADQQTIDAVKNRFNQAFPTLNFDKQLDTHSGTWGIIVAGGLTDLTEAEKICHFARACIRADSYAWSRGRGGHQVCP